VAAALAALVHAPAEAAAALLAEPRQARANAPEHARAAALAREQLRAAVDVRLEELQSSERLQASRLELSRRLSRLQALTHERREASQAAAQQRAAAARQWRGWLEALALPQAMSPDATLEVFDLAEQAMQRLQQRDRRAAKKAAAESQLAAFQKQAAELCAAFPEAAHKSSADPSLALLLLQTEMRRLAAAHAEAARLDERLQELHHSITAAESRLIELNMEIAALLQAAAMPTEAVFVAALQDRGRLSAIDMEHNKLTIELSAGMTDKRIEELEQLLLNHDEDELIALRQEAASLASAAEQERLDKLDTRGRLRQRLDHLLQEDEHRELLAAKEMTIAQLEQDAERYAILSVSAGLIHATKRIYEEERQPVVLRLASGYVNQLTEGRYTRVLTTPGDPSIRLESAEQRIIDSVMLSRGTAEQVYLAMRLALAVEAAQSANLPLLLDDLFVNFDRTRLRAAAELLASIAVKRQLILFTCHEHIRDVLKEQLPQSMLYEMPSRRQ
ncbi:MAG: ATP-binding protein, partial [Candidatus Pristimantibacillus sp.]